MFSQSVCVSASTVDVVDLAPATCKSSTEISLFRLDGLQSKRGRAAENVVGWQLKGPHPQRKARSGKLLRVLPALHRIHKGMVG